MKRLFFFLSLALSFSAFADSQLLLNMKLNPAGSFNARSEKITGELVKHGDILTSKQIVVEIKSLKTENSLRDEHLWKHLNSSKFEKAILTELRGSKGQATGFLEVAGVKKPLKMSYKEEGNNIIASFKVNAHDYKLPEAEYLGIGVADEVKGEVTLPFKSI